MKPYCLSAFVCSVSERTAPLAPICYEKPPTNNAVPACFTFAGGIVCKSKPGPGTDPRFGPNSLTIDTRTQLAWLDLNESLGLSYNQALADTLPGRLFSGYRFATVTEVLGLYSSAGIFTDAYYSLQNPSIASLISLVGPTGTFQGWPEIAGITGTFNNRFGYYSAEMYASGLNSELYYLVTCGPGQFDIEYGPDWSAPTLGDWLVKEIPEPGVGIMEVGGLLLWLSFRIARKSHLPQTAKSCERLPLDCSS